MCILVKPAIKRHSKYRQWSSYGDKSEAKQNEQMTIFTNQIDSINKTNSNIIITGDANLCSIKWNNGDFLHRETANILRSCLDQNGLEIKYLGNWHWQQTTTTKNNEKNREKSELWTKL